MMKSSKVSRAVTTIQWIIIIAVVVVAAGGIYVLTRPKSKPNASEVEWQKGDFTSETFRIKSDEWYLSWEIIGSRSSESYFTHEVYREGEQEPIDEWTVSASTLTSSSGAISGRSNDIAGPGTFYYKIYASSDFSWIVYPSER
jgi:hypothetical protein